MKFAQTQKERFHNAKENNSQSKRKELTPKRNQLPIQKKRTPNLIEGMPRNPLD